MKKLKRGALPLSPDEKTIYIGMKWTPSFDIRLRTIVLSLRKQGYKKATKSGLIRALVTCGLTQHPGKLYKSSLRKG